MRKCLVSKSLQQIWKNVYGFLDQKVNQDKEFFQDIHILNMELDPLKVIQGGALVDNWGTTSQSEEAWFYFPLFRIMIMSFHTFSKMIIFTYICL